MVNFKKMYNKMYNLRDDIQMKSSRNYNSIVILPSRSINSMINGTISVCNAHPVVSNTVLHSKRKFSSNTPTDTGNPIVDITPSNINILKIISVTTILAGLHTVMINKNGIESTYHFRSKKALRIFVMTEASNWISITHNNQVEIVSNDKIILSLPKMAETFLNLGHLSYMTIPIRDYFLGKDRISIDNKQSAGKNSALRHWGRELQWVTRATWRACSTNTWDEGNHKLWEEISESQEQVEIHDKLIGVLYDFTSYEYENTNTNTYNDWINQPLLNRLLLNSVKVVSAVLNDPHLNKIAMDELLVQHRQLRTNTRAVDFDNRTKQMLERYTKLDSALVKRYDRNIELTTEIKGIGDPLGPYFTNIISNVATYVTLKEVCELRLNSEKIIDQYSNIRLRVSAFLDSILLAALFNKSHSIKSVTTLDTALKFLELESPHDIKDNDVEDIFSKLSSITSGENDTHRDYLARREERLLKQELKQKEEYARASAIKARNNYIAEFTDIKWDVKIDPIRLIQFISNNYVLDIEGQKMISENSLLEHFVDYIGIVEDIRGKEVMLSDILSVPGRPILDIIRFNKRDGIGTAPVTVIRKDKRGRDKIKNSNYVLDNVWDIIRHYNIMNDDNVKLKLMWVAQIRIWNKLIDNFNDSNFMMENRNNPQCPELVYISKREDIDEDYAEKLSKMGTLDDNTDDFGK